jgi:hypothetical protein
VTECSPSSHRTRFEEAQLPLSSLRLSHTWPADNICSSPLPTPPTSTPTPRPHARLLKLCAPSGLIPDSRFLWGLCGSNLPCLHPQDLGKRVSTKQVVLSPAMSPVTCNLRSLRHSSLLRLRCAPPSSPQVRPGTSGQQLCNYSLAWTPRGW